MKMIPTLYYYIIAISVILKSDIHHFFYITAVAVLLTKNLTTC